MKKVALVAILKDEGRYIAEWLAFHRAVGFSDIFLFDNECSDRSIEIAKDFCAANSLDLEVLPWTSVEGTSPQLSAYNHFLAVHRSEFEFAAFIDLDEFLVPCRDPSITAYLSEVPDWAGAIAVNQRVFGSSGQKEYSPEPVTQRFRRCAEPNYDENRYVKTIYRLSCIDKIINCHASGLSAGIYVHDDFEPVKFNPERPGSSTRISFAALQLNHYIIKSHGEFLTKAGRGGAAADTLSKRLSRYDPGFFHGRDARINTSYSTVIDRFFPAMLQGLAPYRSTPEQP